MVRESHRTSEGYGFHSSLRLRVGCFLSGLQNSPSCMKQEINMKLQFTTYSLKSYMFTGEYFACYCGKRTSCHACEVLMVIVMWCGVRVCVSVPACVFESCVVHVIVCGVCNIIWVRSVQYKAIICLLPATMYSVPDCHKQSISKSSLHV